MAEGDQDVVGAAAEDLVKKDDGRQQNAGVDEDARDGGACGAFDEPPCGDAGDQSEHEDAAIALGEGETGDGNEGDEIGEEIYRAKKGGGGGGELADGSAMGTGGRRCEESFSRERDNASDPRSCPWVIIPRGTMVGGELRRHGAGDDPG